MIFYRQQLPAIFSNHMACRSFQSYKGQIRICKSNVNFMWILKIIIISFPPIVIQKDTGDEVDIKANKSKKTNQIGYNYYFHYLLFNMFTYETFQAYQTKSANGLKKIFVWLLLKVSPELRLVRTTYRSSSFQPYWIVKTVTKRLIKTWKQQNKIERSRYEPTITTQ